MSERKTNRLKIKRTVEQVAPMMDIDTTMILNDEEIAELHRQTEQRLNAVRLAKKVGRAGLHARLKRTMLSYDDDATDPTPPDPY